MTEPPAPDPLIEQHVADGPPKGLSAEQYRVLLTGLSAEAADESDRVMSSEAFQSAYSALTEVENPRLTFYSLGFVVSHIAFERRSASGGNDGGIPEPALSRFEEVVSELELGPMRPPSIAALHRHLQVVMLERLTTLAEAVTDIDSYDRIADAYIRLPAPGEDDLD